jgi:hypothetical protein
MAADGVSRPLFHFPEMAHPVRSILTLLLSCCLPWCLGACRPASQGAIEPGGTIRIETAEQDPAKRTTVQQGVTAAELGMAYYPGAQVNKSELTTDAKGRVGGAELQTTDPYVQVVQFYREATARLRPVVRTRDEPGGAMTMLNWQDARGNYTVAIRRDEAGHRTVITLARTGAQTPRQH